MLLTLFLLAVTAYVFRGFVLSFVCFLCTNSCDSIVSELDKQTTYTHLMTFTDRVGVDVAVTL